MNNDEEIIRSIGGLETAVTTLTKQIEEICRDSKVTAKFCQTFEYYRESRKDLPSRIDTLERVAEEFRITKMSIAEKETEQQKKNEKVEILWNQYKLAMGLVAILMGLATFIVGLISQGYIHIGKVP